LSRTEYVDDAINPEVVRVLNSARRYEDELNRQDPNRVKRLDDQKKFDEELIQEDVTERKKQEEEFPFLKKVNEFQNQGMSAKEAGKMATISMGVKTKEEYERGEQEWERELREEFRRGVEERTRKHEARQEEMRKEDAMRAEMIRLEADRLEADLKADLKSVSGR
jgi:hypothetical protein